MPRRALLAGLLALSACGLQPVYGPGGAAKKLFGQVSPVDPDTPDEFLFNRRIAERLGPAGGAYELDYTLRIAVVAQGITPDEITTRYSLNGSADYKLTEAATGETVTEGQVSTFTSYSTTGTTVATLTAEYDARQRLARMLADQVVTRLLAAAP
ncbi:LPS assembly lipoprotein LptE [uncultured Paracoccus sp.]|uniref:LPS assembly lipoprotein LptE n=1 Tax=uncultured Paracoccus sp. TaxID=189685 RepID=UPI00261BE350|nr:LPS assembly lipoprotein LptE [uncultured Paracoccus sp.]